MPQHFDPASPPTSVVLPVAQQLVRGAGTLAQPLQGVQFRNIRWVCGCMCVCVCVCCVC